MSILLVVILLILIFGGGGMSYAHWGPQGAGVSVGAILLIVLLLYLLGFLRR